MFLLASVTGGARMSPSPSRGVRKNSPFSEEQATWVVLEYGAHRNITVVRRKFRTHYKLAPKFVPSRMAFQRLVDRFIESNGHVHPQLGSVGRPHFHEELAEKIRDFLKPFRHNKKYVSLRTIANEFNISIPTAWRVLRKKLGWYPYKPQIVVPLSDKHRFDRVTCQWLLKKPGNFEENVIWTDEKWFHLKQSPNKQNERYWSPVNPGVNVECREQGGRKVMCWAAIVKGRVIVHWFPNNQSVNGDTYLQLLQSKLWPEVRSYASSCWFQQDSATVHTTTSARAWLKDKFSNRVISRLTDRPWPARSPDLSPLDFWFWSVAISEVRRCAPTTLKQLMGVVEELAAAMDPAEVMRAVSSLRRRAAVCVERQGASVETV